MTCRICAQKGCNMKIDRLLGLVVYLLNHGRTSAQKLAEEFEVSPRTIVRDLEALDRAGIPIQSFYGADGGYQIMDTYVLNRQAATKRDYDWIVTALQGLVSAYADKSLERTLAKIRCLGEAESRTVSVDLSVAREDGGVNAQLALLEGAIVRKHAVRFSYTNGRGEEKEIQAEPVRLQYRWYNWYLIGYSEKHQDYRMFKLVRMEHLQETEIANSKDHALSEIRMKEDDSDRIQVRLYARASVRAGCREYLNGQITREYENGDFEFCFSVPEHETFWFGALLSFGSQVRVLEPERLRERILRTCGEIRAEYERCQGETS